MTRVRSHGTLIRGKVWSAFPNLYSRYIAAKNMRQLDPKAVWLFFISFILRWFVLFGFLAGYFSVYLFGLGIEEVSLRSFYWLLVIIPILLILFWIWAKLTYRFYRYELIENGFRKELGVIWKKYVTIPYDRIQNVDIYRGVTARILGLSDLNIQTAGASAVVGRYGAAGMSAEGRLPGLSKEIAEQLRDELIQRAHQSKTQGL